MSATRPLTRKLSVAVSLLMAITLSLPAYSASPPSTVTVAGKTLKLLGRGLREFLLIDIYNVDAYSQSGACAPGKIVYTTEVKMLRLSMIRDIPVKRLTSELSGTFEDNMPKKGDIAALKKQIDSFLTYFKKDLKSGDQVEISYVPGKGSTVKQNGKALGPTLPGRDFAELAWRSYFGGNTCCKQVKKMVIEQCKSAGN